MCIRDTSYTTPPPSIGITGRVRNAKDHAPIGWATVGISETNQGVVCDADGRFTLPLRQGGTYTLVVLSLIHISRMA